MVSTAVTEVDLFGAELPSLDELKKLSLNDLAAGIGFVILGRSTEAIEKLKNAENCKEKFMYLGFAFRHLQMFDDAIASFDKAGKKRADSLMVAFEKTAAMREAGRFDEATKELKACANFEKVSAEYHFQFGRLADAEGRYDEAIANYKIAIELDPAHHEALFHLAYACDLRGDDEAAIDYYTQITKIAPVYINAVLNLAVLYEDAGEYDKAAECVNTVLKRHPNHKKAILFAKDINSSKVMVYDEEREKRLDRQSRILEIPISDFELSVRSRNCLKKMGILTLGHLLRTTEADLLSYKNFGETSLVEIKKILDSKGLTLGMALEDETAAIGDENGEEDRAKEELLNKSVEDIELSVRARRALVKLGVLTLAELVGKTEAELLGCKNFGVTSLNEIKECLTGYGLSLRTLE
jgi:DNA-directed RNA polymerase subunit alpha